MEMLGRLTQWLTFEVILSLLPIVFIYAHNLSRDGQTTSAALFGQGELLLITAGISASTVGILIGSGRSYLVPKLLAGGTSLVDLCCSSIWYTDIAATSHDPRINPQVVASCSTILFLLSVASGLAGVALERTRK